MSEHDFRQFKTTSGEEVVCEVMQWNDSYEEIFIRKAMKLILNETTDGIRYYSFRPWMVYQEHPDDIIVVNVSNVVGMSWPTDTLLVQYNAAVEEMAEINATREEEYIQNFHEKAEKSKKFARDKIDEYISRMDSGSNVIDMFDPKRVH